VLVVGLLCLALPATGAAATFTVNDTGDGPVTGTCAPGETCTLRDALAAAQASADEDNSISLPAGRITLTEGELGYARDGALAIVGAGARKTIVDGAGASRVFDIEAGGDTLDATFAALTVTGGNEPTNGGFAGDGGGILFGDGGGELTLRGVAIVGNTTTLNGGGVAAPLESTAPKTVVVEDSTISQNKVAGGVGVGLGGGLYVTGSLEMVNSTVASNTIENELALNEGGGVLAGPGTGTEPTETTIVNSTIVGNSVATGTGGGFSMYNPGALAETSSTITNTIIAGNAAMGALSNCGGALTVVSSHDLSDDGTCLFLDAGSKPATAPLTGGLADNGGETDTIALLPGSPAIDAGAPEACPPTDQRGVARPLGTACDIGSYEFNPAPPTPPAGGGGSSGGAAGAGSGGGTTPVTGADLKLTIAPKPKKPKRGKKLSFKVTVANSGPATATATVFTATVPKATKKVKVPGLAAKACKLVNPAKGKKAKKKAKTRKLTCALGDLAAGKSLAFRIGVRTKKAPRKVVVSGAATSSVADPTPADAKAKATVKLKG
jgi:uncharacterized repeat protein (TIGR01451 family)